MSKKYEISIYDHHNTEKQLDSALSIITIWKEGFTKDPMPLPQTTNDFIAKLQNIRMHLLEANKQYRTLLHDYMNLK